VGSVVRYNFENHKDPYEWDSVLYKTF